MKRTTLLCLLSMMVLCLVGSGSLKGSPGPARGIRNAAGEMIRVFDEAGTTFSVRRPDGSRVRLTEYAQSVLESAEQAMATGVGVVARAVPGGRGPGAEALGAGLVALHLPLDLF